MKGFNGEADGSFPNSKDPASANAAKMRSNARAAAATNTNDPESDLGAQSNALSESGAGSGEIMELEEPKPVWAPLQGAGKVKAVTAGGGDVYSLGSEGQIKKMGQFLLQMGVHRNASGCDCNQRRWWCPVRPGHRWQAA